MRELRGQEQELGHAQRTDFCRVGLAVGLKGRARFQQAHPLEIFFALHRLIKRVRETPEVRAYQACQFVGAFDEASQLDVLPSFAVRHGRVGDSLEQVRAFLHGAKEYVSIQQPYLARCGAVDLQM